ncbi:PD40 domain-containing protein [bacterium]|nr:PD40 domain-containing protein [bacterium]
MKRKVLLRRFRDVMHGYLRLAEPILLMLAIQVMLAHGAQARDDPIYLTIKASGPRLVKVNLTEPLGKTGTSVRAETKSILEFDLAHSNRFELVHAPAGPVTKIRPGAGGRLVTEKIRPDADVFIEWDAELLGNVFSFKAQVKDSKTSKVIFSRRDEVPMENHRAVVHQFVDEMALMLSGKSGIAHCKIAFISDKTGGKELYTADYDGHNIKQLTHLGQIVLSPAFSPRGDKIAFINFEMKRPILSVLDVVTGQIEDLVRSDGIVASPVWSPDGKTIALSISKLGNCDIYLFDLETERLTRLTFQKSIETSPTFAPNGASIAFSSDRTGRPQIYVMNVDGSGLRRITFIGRHNESPSWSNDGSLIAYATLYETSFQLRLIGPDGEWPRNLVVGLADGESPSWSPDGRKLVFSAKNDEASSNLYLVNRDGSMLTRIIERFGNCSEPCWSP